VGALLAHVLTPIGPSANTPAFATPTDDECFQFIFPEPWCCDELIDELPEAEGGECENCVGMLEPGEEWGELHTTLAEGNVPSGYTYSSFHWDRPLAGCPFHPAYCVGTACSHALHVMYLRCERHVLKSPATYCPIP